MKIHLFIFDRVTVEESIYHGFCGDVNVTENVGVYCECNSGSPIVCSNNRDVTSCAKVTKKSGK